MTLITIVIQTEWLSSQKHGRSLRTTKIYTDIASPTILHNNEGLCVYVCMYKLASYQSLLNNAGGWGGIGGGTIESL